MLVIAVVVLVIAVVDFVGGAASLPLGLRSRGKGRILAWSLEGGARMGRLEMRYGVARRRVEHMQW